MGQPYEIHILSFVRVRLLKHIFVAGIATRSKDHTLGCDMDLRAVVLRYDTSYRAAVIDE
jgi:hypothetical protein